MLLIKGECHPVNVDKVVELGNQLCLTNTKTGWGKNYQWVLNGGGGILMRRKTFAPQNAPIDHLLVTKGKISYTV